MRYHLQGTTRVGFPRNGDGRSSVVLLLLLLLYIKLREGGNEREESLCVDLCGDGGFCVTLLRVKIDG